MKVNHKNRETYVYKYKISKDIFSIIQIKSSFCLFFDIFFEEIDDDIIVDLNNINILHYRFIATQRLKDFFVKKENSVKHYNYQGKKFLFLDFFYKSAGNYGVNLVELPDNLDMLPLKKIEADLTLENNYKDIVNYELIGMIGDSNKIISRLNNYIKTGIDFDESKKFIFPNIILPEPKNTPIVLKREQLLDLDYIKNI
jgi:hypothetical protein